MRISDWSSDVCSSDLHRSRCDGEVDEATALRTALEIGAMNIHAPALQPLCQAIDARPISTLRGMHTSQMSTHVHWCPYPNTVPSERKEPGSTLYGPAVPC